MLRSLVLASSRRLRNCSSIQRVYLCKSTASANELDSLVGPPIWSGWTLGIVRTVTNLPHLLPDVFHRLPLKAAALAPPDIANHAITRSYLAEAVERGRSRSPTQVRRLAEPVLSGLATNLMVEELEYHTEDGLQGWVPLRVIQQPGGGHKPVVIFLHPTGSNKDAVLPWMEEYALSGYLTVAIDCRYHGGRCSPANDQSPHDVYEDALVRAWKEGTERPFLLDNVWDLVHLLDYLCTRPDVDKTRIGMTGVSLGGMNTWLCAAMDPRVSVAAPIIGVQNFGWAVRNNSYRGIVESLPRLFSAAAADLGRAVVDQDVVSAVWQHMVPGLLEHYDAHKSLPCIAPRPLLIVNGEVDPHCSLDGLNEALEPTKHTYVTSGAADHLCVYAEPGCGQQVTENMRVLVRYWFDLHLQQHALPGGWWCSVM